MIQTAEEFAVAAQERIASGLPERARQRVKVVATAHTTADSLIYSQPHAELRADGMLLVQAQVYLHFR